MKDKNIIDKKYTWDLEKIYNNLSDFNCDEEKVRYKIDELSKYENIMLSDSDNFFIVISLSFDIERLLDKMSSYVNLLFDLDTSNNNSQELVEKVSNLRNLYSKASYYIIPNILKCDNSIIEKFYVDNEKLIKYKNVINDIFRYKDHTLSDKEEKLLSGIGKITGNCYDTYELFKDCDMSFDSFIDENGNSVELTNSSYSLYIESKDRNVRVNAFNNLYKEFKKYSNTFASLISTNMKELSTISSIEKYNSAIEMSLYRDNVSIDVYNNLIDSVHSNIKYLYDYYNLKKNLLNLDELHLYDIYVPIISNFNKKYSYDEAKDIILNVLKIFGDEYLNKVKEFLDSRIIDVYPRKNKRTGGYSGGSYDTYPYILLNYQDKYNDLSTLIHEMGHSMHSYYSRSYNDYQDSEYKIFVAEVASTVNELLLSYYMIENSDSKEEKLFILNNLIELYKATIYRQTMFAEFEKIISNMIDNEEALTSDKLCNIYYDLNKFYFGDDVIVDEEIKYEWERIPHFYYDFYVYKYATGLSAATVIVNNILSGKEKAVDNYIEFLKCGSKLSPLESLMIAGVDLTKKEVIDDALKQFNNILSEFKDLI